MKESIAKITCFSSCLASTIKYEYEYDASSTSMIFPFQHTQVSQSTSITTPPISKTQTVSKKSFLNHCIIRVGSRSNCVHVTRQTVNTAKHHTRFNDLMSFKAKHGHCDVSQNGEDASLGRW